MHQLIREPNGFQAACGNAVEEQLKLRETWAAIGGRALRSGPSADLAGGRRAFVPPTNDGCDEKDPWVLSCGQWAGM